MSNKNQPVMGIFPTTSVKDIADSLAIDKISEDTCQAVAGDVEYRLGLVIQEAQKFMRHSKRTTMVPSDIDYALQALNVQHVLMPSHHLANPPPPTPLYKPSFHTVFPPEQVNASNAQLYFLKDEEIDLAQFLKNAQTNPPRATVDGETGVRWKAHWLAVEGVQPMIKENPISLINDPTANPAKPPAAKSSGTLAVEQTVKSHLPQELILLFRRLTETLLPDPSQAIFSQPPATPLTTTGTTTGNPESSSSAFPPTPSATTSQRQQLALADSERQRIAGLATLSQDPALSELTPYLIRWLSENITASVVPGREGRSPVELGYLVDAMVAVVKNPALFVEPYLHQLLPPILSILLSIPLGGSGGAVTPADKIAAKSVRGKAADILGLLMKTFAADYETLMPRITSTLIRALSSPASIKAATPSGLFGKQDTISAAGRFEGALLGLTAMGAQTVKHALLAVGGERLRAMGEEVGKLVAGEREGVVQSVMDALKTITPDSAQNDMDVQITLDQLQERVGNTFATALIRDEQLAQTVYRYLDTAAGA